MNEMIEAKEYIHRDGSFSALSEKNIIIRKGIPKFCELNKIKKSYFRCKKLKAAGWRWKNTEMQSIQKAIIINAKYIQRLLLAV